MRNVEVRQGTNMLTGESAARLDSFGEVARKNFVYSSSAQEPSWRLR